MIASTPVAGDAAWGETRSEVEWRGMRGGENPQISSTRQDPPGGGLGGRARTSDGIKAKPELSSTRYRRHPGQEKEKQRKEIERTGGKRFALEGVESASKTCAASVALSHNLSIDLKGRGRKGQCTWSKIDRPSIAERTGSSAICEIERIMGAAPMGMIETTQGIRETRAEKH